MVVYARQAGLNEAVDLLGFSHTHLDGSQRMGQKSRWAYRSRKFTWAPDHTGHTD